MENMPQKWFEMPEIRKRFLDRDVWIPLKQMKVLIHEGQIGMQGYKEEFFGVGSIAVPLSKRLEAESLDWTEIGGGRSTYGYVSGGEYIPSYVYKDFDKKLVAEHLVLERRGNSEECNDLLLNQDVVVALGLKREGDVWLAIEYGYDEVAKIEKDENGCDVRVQIKASYLKDYLCARKMALYLSSYRSRAQIVEDASSIKWKSPLVQKNKTDRWEGRVTEIHEGGEPYGSGFSVLHMSRTDVDYDEDVPKLEFAADEDVKTRSWSGNFKGRKLCRIDGELWRNEWVEPAKRSLIVCGEKSEPTSFFITDNSGTKESRETLDDGSRWLWFKPSVVNDILGIRGSSLGWYTRDTGRISCSPGYGVHFGINKLGYINILTKDIGLLPDWQQQIWAGHNIAPDGKVSAELLASQMEAEPASTQAPEDYLPQGISFLNKLILDVYGVQAIIGHPDVEHIFKRTHRFRAVTKGGLFELAKELYRITGERIDSGKIKVIVKPPGGSKWGSLKFLEKLLTLRIPQEEAYALISPLWGIYTLRNADSHLGSSELEDAYALCHIDSKQPDVIQGYQLIHCCVSCLYKICAALSKISNQSQNSGSVSHKP